MEYEERLKRIADHLREHPNDYQSKIAFYKLHSDSIEHERYLRRIEKRKRIAESKRRRHEESQ